MKTVSLSGSSRANVGKQDASHLRNEGRVPCVLYGGSEQTHFHVDARAMDKLFWTPEVHFVEIDIEGKKTKAMIQDVQQHPVTDAVTHVDFLELLPGKRVKIKLPVRTTGNAIGVINGGRLASHFRRLTVVGAVEDIPDAIELEISHLKIGTGIRIADVDLPGLTILEDPGSYVVAVKMARAALVEDTVEGAEEEAVAEEGGSSEEGEAPAEGGEE